nr:hypothetical protein [Thermoanaerobaculales bacterium]
MILDLKRRSLTPAVERRMLRLLPMVILLLGCLAPVSGGAQATTDGERTDPNAHQRIPPDFADGQSIERVHVHLMNPTPDDQDNERLRQEVATSYAIRPGAAYNQFLSGAAVRRVGELPFVLAVEERLYSVTGGRQVAVALLVTLQTPEEGPPPAAVGALATGELGDLPMLWQDDRSQLKLIFNPAVGTYADRDPWVGNSGAFVALPGQDRTLGVVEAGLELGVGGITRVGRSNTYVYGAASYVGSTTLGRDIFSSDSSRVHGEIEDLYGGILVARKGAGRSFNLSFGRQKFSL